MADREDWNARIIEEFRANDGRVGGPFEGAPLLLLSTTGARTGKTRVNPLMYLADGDRLVVFASKGGAPTHRATSDSRPSKQPPTARRSRKFSRGRLASGAFPACGCGVASGHKAKES